MRKLFKPSSPVGVGGPTVVTVFIILCMTLFAVLSLSVASGQQSLTRRSLESIQRYYAADAQVQSAAAWLAQEAASAPDPLEAIAAAVKGRADMTSTSAEEGLYVTASYPAQGRLQRSAVFLIRANGSLSLIDSALGGSENTGEMPLPPIWQPEASAKP